MPTMPHWAQYILLASILIGAVTVIWTKLIQPLGKLIVYMHEMLPLLAGLTKHFKDDPDYLSVLSDIAGQFKADSGSTLRDVVNGLEASAKESKEAAKELRIKAGVLEENVAIVKELASKDRAEASHKLVLLDDVLVRMKHFEGLLLKAQTSQQPVTMQQLIPSTRVDGSLPASNVIAIVEAQKAGE